MKHLYLALFLIAFQHFSFSQNTTKNKISGTISSNNQPLEFVNITLFASENEMIIRNAMTTENGTFDFENISDGNYFIKANFVGFQEFKSENFELNSSNNTIQKTIELTEDVNLLSEVTIVSERKPLIQLEADKIIMNIENSALSEGNTALELLEKAPRVLVDNDGNISLRGKQGVTIMINGKRSYLSQEQLTNLLKGTSSSKINAIEIITNPSAKYDAAGNAGIINIKLKKNNNKGFNGSANTFYGRGRKNRFGNGLNLNYKTGKFNLFTRANQYYRGESENFMFDVFFMKMKTERQLIGFQTNLARLTNHLHPTISILD